MPEIDKPKQRRKKSTIRNGDGPKAVPKKGKPPARKATFAVGAPLMLSPLQKPHTGAEVDQIMMAYLSNVSSVIRNQREVMLSYIGQPELAPRTPRSPRRHKVIEGSAFDLLRKPGETDAATTSEAHVATTDEVHDDLPNVTSLSTKQIQDLILTIVSEKTGYPVAMLDLDVNMEADLSIDSIKKMEIVGGLRERATFPDEDEDLSESFEKLISIKTLRELLEWITSLKETTHQESTSFQDSSFEGVHAVIDLALPSESLDNRNVSI